MANDGETVLAVHKSTITFTREICLDRWLQPIEIERLRYIWLSEGPRLVDSITPVDVAAATMGGGVQLDQTMDGAPQATYQRTAPTSRLAMRLEMDMGGGSTWRSPLVPVTPGDLLRVTQGGIERIEGTDRDD